MRNLRFGAPDDLDLISADILTTQQLSNYYTGKNVLIVGGSRGVGFGTAMNLAESGANIWIAGRNEKTGQNAINQLKQKLLFSDKQIVKFMKADLSTVNGAFEFMKRLKDENVKFHVVFAVNAVFPDWNDLYTKEGLEKSIATISLGRYILFKEIESLLADDDPRIGNVMLGASRTVGEFERDVVMGKKNVTGLYHGLAHMHWTNELVLMDLAKRINDNVHIACLYPGLVGTELHNGQSRIMELLEPIIISIYGVSEYECGRRMSSVLASPKLLKKKLSYFDENNNAKIKGVTEEEKKEEEWFIKFLDSHIEKFRNK